MRVLCIAESDGLELGQEYRVAVVHAEGYELVGLPGRWPPEVFEVVVVEELGEASH